MEGEIGNCAICLAKLNEFSNVRLDCNHIFHQKCIFRAISIRNACPLCNRVLYVSEEVVPPPDRCRDFYVCLKLLAVLAAIIVVILMWTLRGKF